MKGNNNDSINTNHLIMKMFNKHPKIAIGLVGFVVVAPYIPHVIRALNAYQSVYEKGRKDGYEEARKEIQTSAEIAIRQTNDYVLEDLKSMQEGNDVEWEYLKDKLKILLLPRFKTTLLGDEYVFRYNLKSTWNSAWFLKKTDSENLDKNISKLLSIYPYKIKKYDAGIQIQEIRRAQDQLLDNIVCEIISQKEK